MSELKPTAYGVTRFGMRAVDDYEEYLELMLPEEFENLTAKEKLLEEGLAFPLYCIPQKDYALVPVEPTEEMIEEARYSRICPISGSEESEDIYKAMIKAAQESE